MSNWTFVWAAYISTWVVLSVYTVFGIRKLRRAEERLADVESRNGGAE